MQNNALRKTTPIFESLISDLSQLPRLASADIASIRGEWSLGKHGHENCVIFDLSQLPPLAPGCAASWTGACAASPSSSPASSGSPSSWFDLWSLVFCIFGLLVFWSLISGSEIVSEMGRLAWQNTWYDFECRSSYDCAISWKSVNEIRLVQAHETAGLFDLW